MNCWSIRVRWTPSASSTIRRRCKTTSRFWADRMRLLRASATAPLADWFARLSDVAPDGTVTQITGAGINGAQRESMTEPRDLEPGKVYPLDIEMHLTSWVFPKGHRIRVAISNALWPMVLPTPYAMTTSLELGGNDGSRLVLPVVPVHGAAPPAFQPPQPSDERSDMHSTARSFPASGRQPAMKSITKPRPIGMERSETTYPWGKETDYESLDLRRR